MIRRNSLAFRLLAAAGAVSVVLLVAAGLLLSTLFSAAVERSLDARLQAVLDGLLASVELNEGKLSLNRSLADTRFEIPLNGWYWQISSLADANKQLASPSLLDQRLPVTQFNVADRQPGALVLGCDQVLALGTDLFSKPETPQQAAEQLNQLQGKTHQLLSALVLYDGQEPVWRHVGVARLTMRTATEAWIDGYVQRNWDSIRHSVGAYKLEEEGIQLFTQIEGDYFTVLGLPMLPLLSYLRLRGFIET